MSELFDAPTVYAADFEEAWAAYRGPKNGTKSEAYTAWTKTAKTRMSCGAVGKRIVECCRLYSDWIDAENVKRARYRQADYPKKHMSSWINAKGWEPFMAEAQAKLNEQTAESVREKVTFDGWESEAKQLIAELSPARFTAWFSDVQVKRGERVELIFPKAFKASYVAQYFPYALRKAFGDCTLTADGTKQRWDI